MDKINGAIQIKTSFIDYLLNNYETELIGIEVPYLFGYRRADLVAIINNKTVAYEIKSELDSLSKLSAQIDDYVNVFNEVYVVLAEKYKRSSIISKLPQKVGIYYIDQNNKISLQRKAKEQRILNPEKLIYFFKKEEMVRLGNMDSNFSLRKTREKFLKQNSIKNIVEYSKDILRNKYQEKYKTFLSERGEYTIKDDLYLLTGSEKNSQILQLT
jgi:hypothetical protein